MTRQEEKEILDKHGLLLVGKKLVPNPAQADKAWAFIAKVRASADKAEDEASTARPYKAKLLRQNARAARQDADRMEALLS